MKYAVKRTRSNHKELNRVFNNLYNSLGLQFSATGEHHDGHNDYLHHPKLTRVRYATLQEGYQEVTLEEFKQIINNKTQQMATQQFKPGDRVVITFWHHDSKLPVPCKGTYTEETRAYPPHKIRLDKSYLGRHEWYFKEGEFRLGETKARTFLIQGKSHQVKAITEDLIELGYTLCSIGEKIWTSISNNGGTGSLEAYKELFVATQFHNENHISRDVKFQLPDQYKEALDFAAEQLKPEYWEPPKPVEEVLTLGSNGVKITVGINNITANTNKIDIEKVKAFYQKVYQSQAVGTVGAYVVPDVRFIRFGCTSENHLFSLHEIKLVIDTYNKLNPQS